MSLRQVMQAVIDHYPSVETALLQVQRARLSASKSQSQLGWQVNGQAGVARDISIFGTGNDIISADSQFNRRLASGGTIGIGASIKRQKSEDSFPTVPNPTTTTALDVTYRHPLRKGVDNPAYAESLLQAETDRTLALAQRKALYDQLASQVIELYVAALNTQSRQTNLQQAIVRSKRRQRYLEDRAELGVSEEKDLLQVEAQLLSQTAELQGLNVQWQIQRIGLNRLMDVPADRKLALQLPALDLNELAIGSDDIERIRQKVQQQSAELASIESRLQLAESTIRLRLDDKQDSLDLVMFVGNRTQVGDLAGTSNTVSEMVGGVRLEFQQQFDKHSVDAEYDQALLDRDIALLDKKQLLDDIYYDVASLLAQIDSGQQAIQAYQASIISERAKLKEAERRYRSGRSDTDQLLLFESQLATAELATELQKINVLKNTYSLQVATGDLWKGITLPDDEVAR